MTSLKKALEADKWVPADVPFAIYDVLYYLLTSRNKHQQQINSEEEEGVEEVAEAKRSSDRQRAVAKDIRLTKYTIVLSNGDPHKVSTAFIGMLKSWEVYTRLMEKFPRMRDGILMKFCENVKFYN